MNCNMKPSERINEAFKTKPNEMCSDNVYLLRAFDEIGKILDEQYEQQKPITGLLKDLE